MRIKENIIRKELNQIRVGAQPEPGQSLFRAMYHYCYYNILHSFREVADWWNGVDMNRSLYRKIWEMGKKNIKDI